MLKSCRVASALFMFFLVENVNAQLSGNVTLQNATATHADVYVQDGYQLDIGYTIDGLEGAGSPETGWEVWPKQNEAQAAVYETVSDIGQPGGGVFTFNLYMLRGTFRTDNMSRVRFSVTTDNRGEFADGLSVNGDVTANWTELTPLTAVSAGGATLTILPDKSVYSTDANPHDEIVTVTAATTLTGITGIRLEALLSIDNHPTLGYPTVGRAFDNGNFLLNEITVDYTPGGVAHPGDFDSDGDVDGADFVAWQTNFPKASGATLADGDADADGDVDGADFVVWQTNFPFTPGSGVTSVPEPGAITTMTVALFSLLSIGRWKRRGGRVN